MSAARTGDEWRARAASMVNRFIQRPNSKAYENAARTGPPTSCEHRRPAALLGGDLISLGVVEQRTILTCRDWREVAMRDELRPREFRDMVRHCAEC